MSYFSSVERKETILALDLFDITFLVTKSLKMISPPGGLEPPTFRLTAERASQLRHGGLIYELHI